MKQLALWKKVSHIKEANKADRKCGKDAFHASKVRGIAKCDSCGASRVYFSKQQVGVRGGPTKKKLEALQPMLENRYVCGNPISDITGFCIRTSFTSVVTTLSQRTTILLQGYELDVLLLMIYVPYAIVRMILFLLTSSEGVGTLAARILSQCANIAMTRSYPYQHQTTAQTNWRRHSRRLPGREDWWKGL